MSKTIKYKLIIIVYIFNCISLFSQVPNYVPTNGLLGYWPFTGNANDVSGNGNNGTVSGASASTDRFGNTGAAYSFNGSSNYIVVPGAPMLSGYNDMSISVWVKMNTFNGVQDIVAKWYQSLNCGNNSDTYVAAFSAFALQFATNNNNINAFSSPPYLSTADINVWKHFVFLSGSTSGQSIYINGVLVATENTFGMVCNSTNPLYFGAGYDGNVNIIHRFLNGSLDDIGIWNRLLTPCEIKQLYTASVLTMSASSSAATICPGSSATLSANGANTYQWNNSATGPVIVVNPTTTTNYLVTGTSTLTGCSKTLTVTQLVSVINLSTSTSPVTLCQGGSATIAASGADTYQWSNLGTGSVIVVNPAVTTNYTVTGTNSLTGCSASTVITQAVEKCTAIELNPALFRLTVYPNPVKGDLNVELDDAMKKQYYLEVEDVTGKLVFEKVICNNDETRSVINLKQLNSGCYLIKIKAEAGEVLLVKRIIIEN